MMNGSFENWRKGLDFGTSTLYWQMQKKQEAAMKVSTCIEAKDDRRTNRWLKEKP